jgi:hypothetical protein
MRLLFPVIALPLLIPAASTAQTPLSENRTPSEPAVPVPANPVREMPVINPNSRDSAACPPTSRYEAARRAGRIGAQKLNELPMADAYKAVLRRIDGCNAPIVVSYGLGRDQR